MQTQDAREQTPGDIPRNERNVTDLERRARWPSPLCRRDMASIAWLEAHAELYEAKRALCRAAFIAS